MDIYSVVAGGALAMAGGALTQWMTHIFSARREQHKLLREKAEMICEQLEELTRWVTERRAKALALEPDSETLPPFGKLVALQSLYFREASDEVQHFGYKAVAVMEAISGAFSALTLANFDLTIAQQKGEGVQAAMDTYKGLRDKHFAIVSSAGNEFVKASQLVSQKVIALVATATGAQR